MYHKNNREVYNPYIQGLQELQTLHIEVLWIYEVYGTYRCLSLTGKTLYVGVRDITTPTGMGEHTFQYSKGSMGYLNDYKYKTVPVGVKN